MYLSEGVWVWRVPNLDVGHNNSFADCRVRTNSYIQARSSKDNA